VNQPIKNKLLKICVSLLFVVHILIVIKLVLLKDTDSLKSHFTENYNIDLLHKNGRQGNYIPFYTVKYYVTGTDLQKYTKENLVGNVLLFFPFGILLPVLFNSVNGYQKLIFITLLMSLGLELIQLVTALGTFDVDDIILNVLGAALGFGTSILSKEIVTPKQRPHISE
jgi:glycopeptide antibiotics resistance protein